MTSVSHPLISEILPAPAKSRPPASVRDEDKFVVPEERPVEKVREIADRTDPDRNQIVPAPAPNAPPKRAPDSHPAAQNGNITPDASTTAGPIAETTQPQLPGATPNGATPNGSTVNGANAATPLPMPSGQSQASPANAPVTATNNQAQPKAVFSGGGSTGGNFAQTSSANPAASTAAPSPPGETALPTTGQANNPAAVPSPADVQTSVAAQQSAAVQTANLPGNRTATAGSNGAVSGTPERNSERTRLANGVSSSTQPASASGGADSATVTNVSAAQSASATNAQTQPQNNTQILAQALASAAPEAGATPAPTPVSPAMTGDTLGVTQSFNAEMRAAIDAPTQAAAYTARGAVTAQPATEQIAMQISRAADQGVDRLSVQLKPAELGKVTIDLEIGPDNRLLAVISAERSETLDLLQRDARSLEKALAEAGVKTDSGSLEFNLQGDGDAAEGGRDGDEKLFDGAVMLPGDASGSETDGTLTNTPHILPEGRLDIQV